MADRTNAVWQAVSANDPAFAWLKIEFEALTLPEFVRAYPGDHGGIEFDLWSVQSIGSEEQDIALGVRFARRLIQIMVKHKAPEVLGLIMRAMRAKPFGPIEAGFYVGVSQAAFAGAY